MADTYGVSITYFVEVKPGKLRKFLSDYKILQSFAQNIYKFLQIIE